MPVRVKGSVFPGLHGFPSIIQDDLALLRALYIGSLVADRDYFRVGRPGMKVKDYHMIDDSRERAEYMDICKTLEKSTRYPRTQNHNTRNFFFQRGLDFAQPDFDPSFITTDNIAEIHDKMADRYRLVLIRYHRVSGICTIEWNSDPVMPRTVYVVTDGEKYDALSSTEGVFGSFLCAGCLKTAKRSGVHRCAYSCFSCSALLVAGNCMGDLNLTCEDCGFIFQTQRCYDSHKYIRSAVNGLNRCQQLRCCPGCGAVYRISNGEHKCGSSVWCSLCQDYTSDEHQCQWPEFTQKKRDNLQRKQKTFRFAFYDCETTQNHNFDEGSSPEYYSEHYATTIALCKVLDDFCNFLMTDKTMQRRICIAHNASRFDSHLILRGFLRKGIRPQIINKGSTIIRAEVKMRNSTIVFRDSYTSIPIPLSEFPKAFDLPCEEKGIFPHLANTRENWGKVWDTVPPVRYFSRDFMKPEQQKKFDEWHASMEGKPYNQDEILKEYCMLDVEICMRGCLTFRKLMIEKSSWCPFLNAVTLAGFCSFQLRADFMNGVQMGYFPEAGYGALNQSAIALRYIKYKSRDNRRILQYAHSPHGEKKVKIGNQRFSLDCYEEKGCRRCYLDGALLVGGERADELRARTYARIALLRTKFRRVNLIWECTIYDKLARKPAMKKFFDGIEIVGRLQLREGLFGGRVEVLRSYLKSSPTTVIKAYDIVSMYPSIQCFREYPLGFPEIITDNFKPVEGNIFPYRGVAKVRVLAPRDLALAVLPYRSQGALFFSLCRQCVLERSEYCNHETEEERSWIGTYATVELNLALQRGYKVLKIYECWEWKEWSDQIYRGYFQRYMFMKFAASGFPAGVSSREEQEAYCTTINEQLDFNLRPEDISYSNSLRLISKLANNSGKLGERPCHRKIEYLTTMQYLALRLDASRTLHDAEFEGDDIIRVTHSPKNESVRANKFSSVVHALHVTAYARVLLYGIIERVGSRGAYLDTDSIFFEMDRNEPDPLADLLTGRLGDLSPDTPDGWEIQEGVFAGCKNYSLELVNLATGERKRKVACRGFTKDNNTLSTLSHEAIRDMVCNENNPPPFIPVTRPELRRTMGTIKSVSQLKRWRSTSIKRATREEGRCQIQVPYGFMD